MTESALWEALFGACRLRADDEITFGLPTNRALRFLESFVKANCLSRRHCQKQQDSLSR
jgi:hypothetical protein